MAVKDFEARRAISDSVRYGAAKILDRSRRLDPNPSVHARLLSDRAHVAATTDDPQAWEDVVDCMVELVFNVSRTYFWAWRSHLPSHASFNSVFNAGLEGLTIGVRKYDRSSKWMLSTYATNWIRNKAQRDVYAQCGTAKIPEVILRQGLDPMSPLVASATMSLNHVTLEDGTELADSIDAGVRTDEQLEQTAGLVAVIEILRGIDERMPEIAGLMVDGLGDGKIGEKVGLPTHRVSELRLLAQQQLAAVGYR